MEKINLEDILLGKIRKIYKENPWITDEILNKIKYSPQNEKEKRVLENLSNLLGTLLKLKNKKTEERNN